MRNYRLLSITAGAALVCLSPAAQAATFTTTFSQVGADVIVSSSGAFDMTGMSLVGGAGSENRIWSDYDFFMFGTGSFTAWSTASAMTGPALGPGGGEVYSDSAFGDVAGIWAQLSYIYVPNDYVSNTALAGGATFNDTTLSDLGLATGSYVYEFDNNTYTVDVAGTSAVPLPAGATLLLTALGAAGLAGRRRKS